MSANDRGDSHGPGDAAGPRRGAARGAGGSRPDAGGPDPYGLMRGGPYLRVLVLAAMLGVPLAAGAYGFLGAVHEAQHLLYVILPKALGFRGEPLWWPLPLLTASGLLTAAAIRFLPGTGGHEPAAGFSPGGAPAPRELPGILLAALASLCLGAVIGPEAPLVALGGGAALYAARLLGRHGAAAGGRANADGAAETAAPTAAAETVVGASGSFAAVSTLLGSPLTGAFLLMEAVGLGGPMLVVVLLPGLLASGIGALVFVGLDSWTGLRTDTLALPDVPPVGSPTLVELGWAVVIGLAAAVAGAGVRTLARALQPYVARRRLPLTPLVGAAVAALAIGYARGSGRPSSDVLFSGQTALGPLIAHSADYSVGALFLLLACKGLAYCGCLAAFRGGPIFPAMYLGAAGGILVSHLPGLGAIPGAAMGIGALGAAMLGLPMTAVLLATLLLGKAGLTVMPLVIVAVVTAHVAAARLTRPAARPAAGPPPAAAGAGPGG